MAKVKDIVDVPGVATIGGATDPNPLPPEDPHRAALERENQQLREKLAQLQAREAKDGVEVSSSPSWYRISLAGHKSRLGAVIVEPHKKRADKDHAGRPTRTYGLLELFLAGRKDFQAAAWERYCEELKLADTTRKFFKARVEPGPVVDALELVATSVGDAIAKFNDFNGITSTTVAHKVEKLKRDGDDR